MNSKDCWCIQKSANIPTNSFPELIMEILSLYKKLFGQTNHHQLPNEL